MLALRATALLALASSSVGQILGLDIAADVAGLVTAVITPGSSALIDLNLLAGLLSPADVRRASVSPPTFLTFNALSARRTLWWVCRAASRLARSSSFACVSPSLV